MSKNEYVCSENCTTRIHYRSQNSLDFDCRDCGAPLKKITRISEKEKKRLIIAQKEINEQLNAI